MFQLHSPFQPTGDQPSAIDKLYAGIKHGVKNQVLLGVTGSGKTFTLANIIEKLQIPTLIISHNKTLAGQLYQEMRDFFPQNAVSYFVSYYDYYQPEAYIPQTDTYIEKEAQINDLIDKLRLRSTANILTRNDVIVVASVSCIYNIGSPAEYERSVLPLTINEKISLNTILKQLVSLQYERSEYEFARGTFRIRGGVIDIYPAYEDFAWRIDLTDDQVTSIVKINPISGITEEEKGKKHTNIIVYPAKHFLPDTDVVKSALSQIREDLKEESSFLKKQGKHIEAERLIRRVNYDIEMIQEVGYVNGIENYSRYFDGRTKGEAPFSLLDYFAKAYGKNFLVCIDESHMTIPQIRGMFHGDYSRKKVLIEHGFRLRAAFDNRPLKFQEFYQKPPHLIYVSATPDSWELEQSTKDPDNLKLSFSGIAEQLIRPTGIIDPQVLIRPAQTEIPDLLAEVEKRAKLHQKVLVTTLTKKMAEDLALFCKEKNIRAEYLHSDIETLERSNILDNLRKNQFDVLIGVNLLREGIDLPEVALVAILDADKEGFLRSKTALIQTMGRAARNISGEVILYADEITRSMKEALLEIDRRRTYQLNYNTENNIVPVNIAKPIREKIIDGEKGEDFVKQESSGYFSRDQEKNKLRAMTPYDKKKYVKKLEKRMKDFADQMDFESAIQVRDLIREIKLSN